MEFVRVVKEPDALSKLIGDTVVDLYPVRTEAEEAELDRVVETAFDIACDDTDDAPF